MRGEKAEDNEKEEGRGGKREREREGVGPRRLVHGAPHGINPALPSNRKTSTPPYLGNGAS
jgi:hypothetical protein